MPWGRFDGLEEDFLPKGKGGGPPSLSSEEIDKQNEEDGLWKGESMDENEDSNEDIHIVCPLPTLHWPPWDQGSIPLPT